MKPADMDASNAHDEAAAEPGEVSAAVMVDEAASGTLPGGAVLVGLYPEDAAMSQALEHLDFGFLKRGDSALIKLASSAAARGWDLSGGRPESVRVIRGGAPMDGKLLSSIEAHGKGMYRFG